MATTHTGLSSHSPFGPQTPLRTYCVQQPPVLQVGVMAASYRGGSWATDREI